MQILEDRVFTRHTEEKASCAIRQQFDVVLASHRLDPLEDVKAEPPGVLCERPATFEVCYRVQLASDVLGYKLNAPLQTHSPKLRCQSRQRK